MEAKLMRTGFLVGFCLFLATLSGCGGGEPVLTEADDGSLVRLVAGERFSVSLESNPTTGYSWQILEVDPAMLATLGDPEYQPDSNQSGLVGAGGTETFRFEALGPGETSLSLGYKRPWEQDVQPLTTFTLSFQIRAAEE